MNNINIRYQTPIFANKIEQITGITNYNIKDFSNFIKEPKKHYGSKLINFKEEILVIVEYTNIIWNYKIYYGSYKNKYQSVKIYDHRWEEIEKRIKIDLKMIGLNELK